MTRTSSGTPRARALGAELRRMRAERGVGVRELARRLGTDHSKLSRYESGTIVPPPEHVASVLTILGVEEAERDRLIETARGAGDSSWFSRGVFSVGQELAALIEFERTACSIVDVANTVIPGLLQTAAYAREIMSGLPRHEVESRVAIRMGRGQVLRGAKAPEALFLMLESALRTPIGGREVLIEQLHHVRTVAELANVTVQVLPQEIDHWSPAYAGAYDLFQFARSRSIVHVEQLTSSVFLYDEEDLAHYQQATESVRKSALDPSASLELVSRVAQELEETI